MTHFLDKFQKTKNTDKLDNPPPNSSVQEMLEKRNRCIVRFENGFQKMLRWILVTEKTKFVLPSLMSACQ